MTLRLITAQDRLAEAHSKNSILVVGPPKIGKTSLLYTLDEATTLALDFEAGMKSVITWKGRSIPLRTLEETWDIACLIGGANPALPANKPFSQAHYEAVCAEYKGMIDLSTVKTVFFDSASDLSHVTRVYSEQQPSAFNKHGQADTRGMYGELGRNLIDLFVHLQQAPGLNFILVAKLDKKTDEFNRVVFDIQMEGQAAPRALLGLVDVVVTMSLFDCDDAGIFQHNWESGAHRAFCCHRLNPWGLPAGNRSLGNLDMIEEPHLGNLIDKMNAPARAAIFDRTLPGVTEKKAAE